MPPFAKGAARSVGGFIRACANVAWFDLVPKHSPRAQSPSVAVDCGVLTGKRCSKANYSAMYVARSLVLSPTKGEFGP
jgi:hypothetical protein